MERIGLGPQITIGEIPHSPPKIELVSVKKKLVWLVAALAVQIIIVAIVAIFLKIQGEMDLKNLKLYVKELDELIDSQVPQAEKLKALDLLCSRIFSNPLMRRDRKAYDFIDFSCKDRSDLAMKIAGCYSKWTPAAAPPPPPLAAPDID
jgi:hypothetical protein